MVPLWSYAQSNKYQNTPTYRINRNTIEEFREDKEAEGGFITNKSLKYAEITGNPYLNPQFREGSLMISDGTILDNCLFRYNMFTDQIEYLSEDVVYEVSPKSKVKRATTSNLTLVFLTPKINGKQQEGYFEVLLDGKITVYKKYSVKFIPPIPASPYDESRSAHFGLPENTFYVANSSGGFEIVKTKKGLVKFLVNKKSEVSGFISESGLSVNNESDLLKIVRFYNSL